MKTFFLFGCAKPPTTTLLPGAVESVSRRVTAQYRKEWHSIIQLINSIARLTIQSTKNDLNPKSVLFCPI